MGAPKGTAPWNAGTSKGWLNAKGYRELRIGGKTVKEHRYIMEQHLGRRLHPDEDVHHINGNKADNRLENLQVVHHGEHARITNTGRTYPTGRKYNYSDRELKRRSDFMKHLHKTGRAMPPQFRAALSRAEGKES